MGGMGGMGMGMGMPPSALMGELAKRQGRKPRVTEEEDDEQEAEVEERQTSKKSSAEEEEEAAAARPPPMARPQGTMPGNSMMAELAARQAAKKAA